ncbi:P-loop containing nucleoside triphosphate hydrolase protein [Hypoxylon sp. NC1633]|nr:P-loop containing nucleoside triphosphate hydrolase protein [Hypoxylon sp. NC1633]
MSHQGSTDRRFLRQGRGIHDQDPRTRSQQLDKFFYKVVEGKWRIGRPHDASRFLESIVNRTDKPDCIERLVSSKSGLSALHKSLTLTISTHFINTFVSKLLQFFEDPVLKRVCDGELLNQVLWAMVDPPLFWNSFVENIRARRLEAQAVEGFAWLLLQLVLLPSPQSSPFRQIADSLMQDGRLENSSSLKARSLLQKIRALVQHSQPGTNSDSASNYSPGGRHDNDFVNYHDIAMLPTRAELQSTERPYYQQSSAAFETDIVNRAHAHLDNQYRLLREDMLDELREDIVRTRRGTKKAGWRNMTIKSLTLEGLDKQAMENNRPCALVLRCETDILNMRDASIEQRKKELKKKTTFLRHQSFGCLKKNDTLLAFATVDRNEGFLSLLPPRLCLQVIGVDMLGDVLLALRDGPIDFLLSSTPIFAYEPILQRLLRKTDIELEHDILGYSETPMESTIQPETIIDALETSLIVQTDLQQLLQTTNQVYLDPSQVTALIHGLKYQTCQIQGPPGTGKSLVGALLAKILLDQTEETMLVLSYTNHALDQFAEDLLDIGINPDDIVRLGSKSTNRTEPLTLRAQKVDSVKMTKTRHELINLQKEKLDSLSESTFQSFDAYTQERMSHLQLLEHIEFSESEEHFYDALSIPEVQGDEIRVGRKGVPIKPDYLFQRWANGNAAGAFAKEKTEASCDDVWGMTKQDRHTKIRQWEQEICQEKVSALVRRMTDFNKTHKILQSLWKERTEQILQRKRIICCTTTAASMHAQEIQAAAPGIIIVEEAGEVLESHILAAMGPSTKQLIQIGDHKQLRPKVKNFKLTVEAGRGYDLNRSLFERLILQGRPHCTLLNQHRMRPEISRLIRHNYPDLQDAQSTQNRPHLSGFQDDVVFFNHNHPEARDNDLVDKLDQGAASSKQNIFEAEMVLKCVRYLAQQNYKTTDLVILTPYLGQLSLLRNKLSEDHDPILNDFDSHDLVQAGVLPAASAEVNKKPIRLSTIDNYQGEESDIVVVSLTRSNEDGDIGFMAAPERLNVLISRARNALIMIGSANTFMNAKKGREEWTRLFDHLKMNGKIHDGFPLKCEKHLDTKHIARSVEDFELHCPDGGCTLPCNEVLSCGKHQCPMRCHLRIDHSRVPCNEIINDVCPEKHKLVWQCSDKAPPACQTCRHEKEERDRKARRDKDLELDRQAKQFAYAKQLRAVIDDIALQRKIIKDHQEEQTRQQTLDQHRAELAQLTKLAQNPTKSGIVTAQKAAPVDHSIQEAVEPSEDCSQNLTHEVATPANVPGQWPTEDAPDSDSEDEESSEASQENSPMPMTSKPSPAEVDWQHQKDYENASNEALDSLFKMIGLESVKREFLTIKAKIDTCLRQGADIKDERLGAALLGNPGTGKTTVARLYGKFLSSVGAIPGDHFEETTGSRLASDGIQGCKALIDQILNKGGGVFFLDEAYQIVSGSSLGGAQVLDFLLAEIENLTGKVVFVFAGYRKQMESFFAHNPGIPSRIPIQLDFQDYEDNELLKILNYQLEKKFNSRMKIANGSEGLYMRVVARRIGRGRGREGFGNAREVQNVLSTLLGRQADRLHQARQQGDVPDDLLLQKIDLVGPEPSQELSKNKDWLKLQAMVGLKSVKQSVTVLVNRLQTNYDREMKEQPLIECSLNKVFVGNPGTGKTTVAKLYGKILKALGLLSNGEVIIKNPADFVGAVLGQSEKNTKAILESTKGKVLIIDEAYMLASGTSDAGGASDPYKTAVVDTIVAEVQSTALEDRCVLLLGYREQMEDMFQKVNPGLTRRFPISSGFNFEDYDDDELRKILNLKLKQQGFRATESAKNVVLEVLQRARNRPNFGNAGEVDIVLDQAKERQQKRLSEHPGTRNLDLLLPEDIDPEFDRGEHAATNIHMLFRDVVGCEDIVEQLEGYQQVAQNMRSMDMDPRSQIPFGFVFRGPPGTGKTTTARKMGKIYYDMGFLAAATVVECSATDLIGQFVGHTGPKVQKKFDEALGRVLFIDEAYRLAEGHFAKEAMDEIVDCLTKERYQNKLVVILAGYDNDINKLMNQNPGLTSRFPETVSFRNLPPRHCRDLLLQCLQKKRLDIKGLEASPTLDSKLLTLFGTLAQTPSWGNARDVQTLAKSIFSNIMKSKTPNPSQTVSEDLVVDVIKTMIKERSERATADDHNPMPFPLLPVQQQDAFQEPPPPPQISTSTETVKAPEKEDQEQPPPTDKDEPRNQRTNPASIRDAGVSDAVWDQLQQDKAAFEQRQRELAEARREAAELERRLREQEAELKRQKDDAARREALRKLEAARVRRDLAERARLEREDRARKELEVKARLKKMGLCPMGFEWISQDDGYRCAGGSHFMSNADLGI